MIQSKRINGVDVNYAIADPKADDIYAAFKIGATVKELGQAANATIAANLNYANNTTGTPIGRVIIDGKTVISDEPKTLLRDELYMLPDKSLHIGKAPKGALWTLQGSPPLLRNGVNVVTEGIKRDQLGTDIWANNAKHYRIAYGLTVTRWLVVVRTKQAVTLDALAAIMAALGCVDALNGDGGGSACLWPADGQGRKMGAALVIKKGVGEVLKLIGDQNPDLVIDPGHGGSDPGASGNGIIEKLMTLAISLYQFHRFKELGVKVALTRDSDISLGNVERAALVKNSGAKYCMSNHFNAAEATSAAGVEVIHSIYSDGKLARALMEGIAAAGQVKRGTPVFSKVLCDAKGNPILSGGKKQDHYFMHRWTGSVSTAINEYGFCTNVADAARLQANWQAYAEAAVKAYCLFVGHKYIAPKTVVAPPVTPPSKPIDGFADIAGHWALPSIRKAIEAGVITGVAVDRWEPDQPPTRAQLAVILDRLGLLNGEVK